MGRKGIAALGIAAVLGGWWARPRAQPAAPDLVFTPGPEEADAVKRGAADVKAAQALARKKKLVEAVALLEQLAVAHPAATHDCNLALAYLRAGQLTRAQLAWDVSRQRGKAPPDWCESDLAGQLAAALRERGFVPLTLVVSPAGADVEVAGTHLRDLGLVWLPPGTYTVHARAEGMVAQSVTLAVAPPSPRATIALEPPAPPIDAAPPEPIDAPVAVPIDAAPVAAPVDAMPSGLPPPPPLPSRMPAFVGVAAGGVGFGLGLAFHLRALGTKRRANDLVAGTPMFEDQRARFGTERAVALGGYAFSAASFGFAAWWWLRRERAERAYTISIGQSDRGDGAMLTIGGELP